MDVPWPTSHGLSSPDPVDVRDAEDLLFLPDGQRDPLLQALYTESLVHRRNVDTIDRLLDAHRLAYGEPEQVAYAQKGDVLHERPLPLVSSEVGADAGLQRYLEEHRAWNPVTQRERTLSDCGLKPVAIKNESLMEALERTKVALPLSS